MPIPLSYMALNGALADISTAGTIHFTSPIDGWLRSVQVTLTDAITDDADAEIAVEVDGDEKATATVAAESPAGMTIEIPFAAVHVSKGSLIAVSTDGASTGAGAAPVTVLLSP